MADAPVLYGPDGQPIKREVMTQRIAGPTVTGVRSVITGYPGNGLTPSRLARLMRDADQGDPLRYLELAEMIEERDLHYVGVLGTRKRSVAQIDITVEAASDDAVHVAHADMLRQWLMRDCLQDELFDILDAIGKGVSFTEIVWDSSEGQWQPKCLEWTDPRWFVFDRIDGRTPLLRMDDGSYAPLDPGKFICANLKAKSGLPIRSGLARQVAWAWMFKSYTQRDWAIFTQAYGQPIRIGKYSPGASEPDKDVLFRAVANIAGDCAAIIPADMEIEFVSLDNAGAAADLYLKRCDWLDQQVSKAVLGQTATTDAIAGGHAVGQEHRQVQEDIERADCKALGAILNRDLVKVWIDLEYGPQQAYPKLRIGRREQKDIALTTDALAKLVPMGLNVQISDVRDMLGFADPDKGAAVLVAPALPIAPADMSSVPPALQAQSAAGVKEDAINDAIKQALADDGWEQITAPLVAGLGDKLAKVQSLDEARAVLATHFASLDASKMTELLARLMFASRLAATVGDDLTTL